MWYAIALIVLSNIGIYVWMYKKGQKDGKLTKSHESLLESFRRQQRRFNDVETLSLKQKKQLEEYRKEVDDLKFRDDWNEQLRKSAKIDGGR